MLQYLLRSWATNAARQQFRETAMHTLREQLSGAAGQAAAEEARQRPCDVGIVFALGIEAGGLEDRLDGALALEGSGFTVRQGGLARRHVVLLIAGHGRAAARRGVEALIAGHRPRLVLSAGLAGGLQPELRKFDIVVADSVADEAGERLAIDVRYPPEPHVHIGRLLTVDRIVRTPDEKRRLGREHQALAVDMETAAVAAVCREQKIRFMAVRIVSDTADDELPRDLGRLLKQKTTAGKLGAALGAIVNRPSSVKDLYRLQEDALLASDRLAKFLAALIKQLPMAEPEPSAAAQPE
jgi:adenosylhomocysteine nucleosidase